MNNKIKHVVNGFFQLNLEEQKIFIKEIEKLLSEQNKTTTKEQFNETIKRSLGPFSIGNCTCCGK
jgi:polyphosphate kinase